MSSTIFHFANNRSAWAVFLKEIRNFFDDLQYTEVMTPYLVNAGAFESTIDTLKVTHSDGHGELHSSPEIEMKSILAQFPQSIYQICKTFRDDPESPYHAKEFTMLEFYKPKTSSQEIEEETIALFKKVCRGQNPVIRHSVYELVKNLTGIDLETKLNRSDLCASIKRQTSIHVTEEDSWSDLFFKIMLEIVEPSLPKDSFCLLNEYPIAVSPLSAPVLGTPKAQRFEIYFNQIELCNGCSELADEKMLKERYELESHERSQAGKRPHPIPKKLFESAKNIEGFSGVAVGLERLFFATQVKTNT